MRMDSEQRIKISGWRKRQPNIQDINFNDPASFRPLAMGKHPQLLWPHATIQGWMTKHMPPAFSFTKTRHRRYVLLLDRIIYTFKNDNPKNDFREFFELTANTNIFVTDQFPSVLYCIEIQRKEDGRTWYLQAEEGPEDLKLWMDKFKRTVQCLKLEEEEQQQLQFQHQQLHHRYPYQQPQGAQSSPQQQRYHYVSAVITNERLEKVQLDSDNPPPTTAQKDYQQKVITTTTKKPSVSSTSSSEASYEHKYNSHRYSAYSYHSAIAPPPPQQPPPSIPPPPIPSYQQQDLASYYYYPEHQISVEHMTTSAVATASAALVSPMVTHSTPSRRPSRLPEILPPQLPPPTSTLPPPPSPSMR